MALMTITSDNNKFSWVLVKNPDTGLISRSIRQGVGCGWYSNENTYHMYFKDGFDVDSYSKDDFEYLSQNAYGHPAAYMGLITTLLRDVVKDVQDSDTEASNTITLHQVNFRGVKLLQHIQSHLAQPSNSHSVSMIYSSLCDGCYKIEFTNKGTLNELVNVVLIVCLFLSGEQGMQLTKLNEDFVNKYVGMINKLDLPYYLRYVFARNFLKSVEQFNKYKEQLETASITLAHGDTGFQRLRFIEKHLDFQRSILDVGCGEGVYALNLPKRTAHTYHAVDIDSDIIDVLTKKVKARELDVVTYKSLEDFKSEVPVDILLVEVIEHMPKKDAEDLILKLLTKNFSTMFVTTPDKDFNKHYLLGDEFRHDDHDWEDNRQEFQSWFSEIVSKSEANVEIEFVGVGDCVDGVHTTQGVIIKNKVVQKQAIVCVGCPASGKSTFAENICGSSESWEEINRDTISFGKGKPKNWISYKFTKFAEDKVTKKWNSQLDKAVSEGKNLVLSDTNLTSKYREALIDKLKGLGYCVEVKVFDVDFDELLARDTQRQGGVGYEVLLKSYIKFRHYLGDKPYDLPESGNTVIFDIDGTLADHNHVRSPYDLTKVLEDKLIIPVGEMLRGYVDRGYNIVILSGRDESCREDTEAWLEKYNLPFEELFMRKEKDNRKDYIVKKELFDTNIRNSKYKVIAVVDDRKQVIEQCWSVLGIPMISVGSLTERF